LPDGVTAAGTVDLVVAPDALRVPGVFELDGVFEPEEVPEVVVVVEPCDLAAAVTGFGLVVVVVDSSVVVVLGAVLEGLGASAARPGGGWW
jgi:hypothetical protein